LLPSADAGPSGPGHRGLVDGFLFDREASGRSIKCMVIVDDATHESVAIVADHSPSAAVT